MKNKNLKVNLNKSGMKKKIILPSLPKPLEYMFWSWVLIMFFLNSTNAQVGIQTDSPDSSTSLHVKSKHDEVDTTATPTGVLFVPMSSTDRDRIVNPVNGLLVYNTDENCFNYYASSEWRSLCGAEPPAEIEISTEQCENTQIEGTYRERTPTTSSNYILWPITVTKEGSLDIVMTSDNGYSFSYSTTSIGIGTHTIQLEATGTPAAAQTDTITCKVNGEIFTCTFDIEVLIADPKEFTVDCDSSAVNGNYVKGVALTPSNTISVSIQNTGTEAVEYSLYTDAVNDVSFNGTGTVAAGSTITANLVGTGTPSLTGSYTYTIYSNSTVEVTSCAVTVEYVEVFRTVKILGLGSGIYQPGSASISNTSRAIIEDKDNFGDITAGDNPTSSEYIEGMQFIDGTNSNTGTQLQSLIDTNNPDIIVVGYSYNVDANEAQVLLSFMEDNKGIVLYFNETTLSSDNLFNALYNTTVNVGGASGAGSTYALSNVDDGVLNGSFGDLRGKYIGEDASSTKYLDSTTIDASKIIPYAYDEANEVVAFRDASRGFIFAGDGGFLAGDSSNTSSTIFPAAINADGTPTVKTQYSNGGSYNSFFYANAIEWAIKQLKVNRP